MITTARFLMIIFCLAIAITTGCSKKTNVITNTFKSTAQIKLDEATQVLEDTQSAHKKITELLDDTKIPSGTKVTTDVIKYRRLVLEERKLYVKSLMAEYDKKEAELEKRAHNAGYFALGTKGVVVSSGISSAILVAASSANAAIVAGLGALSSGAAAFQESASDVGYSAIIAHNQAEALKAAVSKVYTDNKIPQWEYLNSFAEHAKQDEWEKEMQGIETKIACIEAAVRFTKYEFKTTATNS